MTNTNILTREFEYYINHKQKFIEKYNGKFIVLKSHEVVCESDSRKAAISAALKKGYKLGTFLVQYVKPDINEVVHRYCSRVYC